MTASTNLNQLRQSLRSSKQTKTIRVTHSDKGYLYRYDTSWTADHGGFDPSRPIFQLWEYPILSITPHTFLIFDGSKKRRIYKDNSRGWAHQTVIAARQHYVRRKLNQFEIIERQRDDAITVLKALSAEWGEDTGDVPEYKTIRQVYEAELLEQQLEDDQERMNDLYGDGSLTP